MEGIIVGESQFAKGERSRTENIIASHALLAADDLLTGLLEAMPLMVAILDENRHIIYANSLLTNAYGNGNLDSLLGTRPGEMVNCVHAWENELGCGTTVSCRFCGAVAAILAAQKGRTVTRECRIMTPVDSDPLDLRIKASPFEYKGCSYTIIAMENIADEKRREILERTFFHDIMNTAGNIQGVAVLAAEAVTCEELQELAPLSRELAAQLISEIRAQQELFQAERNRLKFTVENVSAFEILASVANNHRNMDCAMGKKIVLDREGESHELRTGAALLSRVLGNLLKNALEASGPGDTVTLGCRHEGTETRFWVHNPAVMSDEARHQVFQRSFSTKGPGRGLGTYSIKLLGEKYLQGEVGFTSKEGEGTTFTLIIPDNLEEPEAPVT